MIEQLLTGRRVAIADAVAIENNPLTVNETTSQKQEMLA